MKSYIVFSEYVFARFLEIFHNHPDPFEYLFSLNLGNFVITKFLAQLWINALYMSYSFWLLGVESRDFSQAEKETTACKAK